MLEERSPKSHSQEVIEPWEVSLNCTVKGALPLETSRAKDATGGGMGVGVGVRVGVGVGVGVGVSVGVGVGVAVGVSVGVGVGVGVGWAQATSSNALKAKRNCKRKSIRMGRIVVKPTMKGNFWKRAHWMSMPTFLDLPIGQNWQLGFYLCEDGNGDPNRREYQTVGTLPCAVTNWGEVAAWCLRLPM